MTTANEPSALTDEERDRFEGLIALLTKHSLRELPDHMALAVVRSRLLATGTEVAVVSVVEMGEQDDEVDVTPLAVLITDDLFDLLEQPS